MDVELKLFVLPNPIFGNLVASGELLVKLHKEEKDNQATCTSSFCLKFENPIFSFLKLFTKGCGAPKEEEEPEKLENDNAQELYPRSIPAICSVDEAPLDAHPSFDVSSTSLNTDAPFAQLIGVDSDVEKDQEATFQAWIEEITHGLQLHAPELSEDGVNGTYFLKNPEGNTIGVFKPLDEQGDHENNPKKGKETVSSDDDSQEPVDMSRHGISSSDTVYREVAAFLLDRKGFFGVPKTSLIVLRHPELRDRLADVTSPMVDLSKLASNIKLGSLQEYIENDGSSADFSPSLFPVNEVHKIGILDMMLFNTDRHSGNILLKKQNGVYKLIPIDHGFSLPESLDGAWFDWLTWPQAKKPFDEDTKNFIEAINIEEETAMLKKCLGIEDKFLRTMKISTTWLKKAASRGLNLFQIADVVCRQDMSEPSELEVMCQQALKECGVGAETKLSSLSQEEENAFFTALWNIMDDKITSLK
mmetsp:Transcript_21217/g.29724  ORF Transcript_21217/g.29724 Transcript_21217/m.29724 type:complete len:474 (+) Transcript_21217:486-1907(+)|eukprot:CAMPEP_0168560942 /NCGR_PEP_ID=MMETSP0413-20121227/11328_1 /TAXON_ID=136452 /ORGANISM="Filamoeba nolandi, Strain NC-AS-23-1" /LENGTH=473 /DNA_ID=CAMNT_0008592275 /DNA_START=442 /DNA_END=1863 /DNA_ORIENTATION=+